MSGTEPTPGTVHSNGFLSEPMKKRENASHPIKLFQYGTERYRNFPTHTKTPLKIVKKHGMVTVALHSSFKTVI